MADLEIKDLHVSMDGKEILKGVTLNVNKGEIHALMGPNGSGKTTLSFVIMGHPSYKIEKGKIFFRGKDITEMKADERARLGLFLSFQYPHEVSGVTMANFLRTAVNAKNNNKVNVLEFKKLLDEKMELLSMNKDFAFRYLNEGFSGGEKKKAEILQLAVLNPEIAILDETDSGLDADALRIVGEGISKILEKKILGILLITHYNRILRYIKPHKVTIMVEGKVIDQGGPELADEIEANGYKKYKSKVSSEKD